MSKLSELTAASNVGRSDLLYVVQANSSKKANASVLFENLFDPVLKGNVSLDSTVQLLASPGIIDLTKPVTHLTVSAANGTITIPNATKTNQIKIITMISAAGGTYTISSNIAAGANVSFNAVGDTATLLYTNSKWFVIGGTASIT